MNNVSKWTGLLPTRSDWRLIESLFVNVGLVRLHRSGVFVPVVSDDALRLLTIIARYLSADPKSELLTSKFLVDAMLDDHLQDISGYRSVEYSGKLIAKSAWVERLLTDLIEAGFVESDMNVMRLRKESRFNVATLYPDINRHHGRERVFYLSGKGAIAYELNLLIPRLIRSVRGIGKYSSIGDYFINYGILARDGRIQWCERFVSANDIHVEPWIEESIFEAKRILADHYDNFFDGLVGPQTYLAFESAAIREYIYYLDLEIHKSEKEDKRYTNLDRIKGLSDEEYSSKEYDLIVGSNRLISLRHAKGLCEALAGLLEQEWQRLGIPLARIGRCGPPRDFLLSFVLPS